MSFDVAKMHDETPLDATRLSMVERLGDWGDQQRWQAFFDMYARLIYSVARRAGLSDAEAHDVVQETVLSVAKSITRYDRTAGRFKPWLLQMTRWRIADQFRKRLPPSGRLRDEECARETATLDRIAAPGLDLESAWDEEWKRRILDAAMERVKRVAQPQHFQVFDCAIRKQWSARKIASELGLNIAQVYLIKHRLAALLRKELKQVEAGAE